MESQPLFSPHSHRLRTVLLLMTGLYVCVSMRLNLSMGVTCMVNSTAFETSYSNNTTNSLVEAVPDDSCQRSKYEIQTKNSGYTGSLLWTPAMQSLLLSGTFYGALVTISISGYLADRFGPKVILLIVALDYIVMTLFGPLLAENSYWAYFGSRIIMGLGEGFLFPCLNSMSSKWFLPTEKSTMAAIYTSGNQLAAGFTPMIVSVLCTSFGWHSIFYLLGAVGIVWCLFWCLFVTNTPSENQWISDNEKAFLEGQLSNKSSRSHFKNNAVPWRRLLIGHTVQSTYSCHFCSRFSASLLQGFLPTYLKEVLFLPIHMNGLFTMVPFVSQLAFKNIFGLLSDNLKKRGILTNTKAAIVFQTLGSVGSAISLTALVWFPSCHNPYIALPILALYGISFACFICGFFTSLISIAPPYSGTITSISVVYATLANCGGPLMLSFIDYMEWSNKWSITFLFTAAINLLSGIYFYFYGSADVQTWAKSELPEHSSSPFLAKNEAIEEKSI